MRYLTQLDYNVVIQNAQTQLGQFTQLQQLTQNNEATLLKSESIAIEEAYSYLHQRYNIDNEFQNTGTWSYGLSYSASNRVYMNYGTFSASASYALGDCVIYGTEAYALTGTDSFSGSFDQSYFSDLGAQNAFYYVKYPAPLFNYEYVYNTGDLVYWDGFIWVAQAPTPVLGRVGQEQYVTIQNVPYYPFPTDYRNTDFRWWRKLDGVRYTTPIAGTTYSIGTQSYTYSIYDTLPTNTDFWTPGDNRSQLMILHIVEMALYYLNKTLAPNNIPSETRITGYKDAIKYLRDVGIGDINSPVLQLQPGQGEPIRYGGNVRKTTYW